MTDDTQNSPAGETSTTPKRPRRTSTKRPESSAKTAESTTESKSPKATAKTATAKSPRSRTQKSSTKTAPKAASKAESPDATALENTPPLQTDPQDNALQTATAAAKPKPRTSRRTSPKTGKSAAPQADISAETAVSEDISAAAPKASTAKTRGQGEKTSTKNTGRRPATAKTRTADTGSTAEQSEATSDSVTEVARPVAAASVAPEISLEPTPIAEHIASDSPAADAEATPSLMPEAPDAEGEAPARKSRRGRRGGRGRSKNKARDAQNAADAAAGLATDDTLEISATSDTADEEVAPTQNARNKPAPKAQKRVQKPASAKAAPTDDLDDDEDEPRSSEKIGRRKMFISVVPGEQVEVALVEEGAIHEYYLEMLHQAKTKGNIYKGVIHNIDTNLQAAFVNYGANKNGFLQIDEVHPEYYLTHHEAMKGKKFPPMQKVLKAGQEVLVQVVKEPSGSKGAFLTTWLSLAGRFLVLTPGQEQIGVSRKVVNDEERARLREMMNGIDPGEGLGVIVRTVSAGTSKTTLKNDLQYLKRVWKDIRKRGTTEPVPSLIYQEPGLAERAVRDYLTDDVCEVWVDDGPEAEALRETVSLLFPRKGDLVRVHNDLRQTLWERFNIQRQLEQIYSREVTLPSGGRLVFDQTEALMAIDINSGKISGKGNFEAMALKTNVEAAECIARQLKLRDIGGQIVIDFIEMRDKNHIREVEKTLRSAMKNDRARHDVGRMSSFGLLEIVRQRTASSALAITMEPCPACGGTGLRRNIEWQSLQVMREIARLARICGTGPCQIELATELGLYLLNHKRDRLREMEKQHNVPIEIKIRP